MFFRHSISRSCKRQSHRHAETSGSKPEGLRVVAREISQEEIPWLETCSPRFPAQWIELNEEHVNA